MTKRHVFMLTAWHVVAIMTLLSAGALLLLIAYWTLQPFGKEAVEFPQGLTTTQLQVKAGDAITLEAPYCKNIETQSTMITRWFQDDLTYYLPSQNSNVPTGCNYNYKAVVDIPKNLPADDYTYNISFTYKINPIKSVYYTFQSNRFTVISDK
jgi:hypothetical protein